MKLFGFEIKKVNKDPVDTVDKKIPSVYLLPWQQGRELEHDVNQTALVSSYRSWVYVCASKNSQAVANAKLKLYVSKTSAAQKFIVKTKKVPKEDRDRLHSISGLDSYLRKAVDVEEVTEHPFLVMVKNVNPTINRFDMWELTELFLEMTGNSYWYVVKDTLGTPSQIWVVPSQGMKVVAGKDNLIMGYVYSQGMLKVPFETDEIIHFKMPSLTSQLYGAGPMQAVMDAYVFDQSVKGFETTLMKNMGRPEGVLQTEVSISDAEFIRLQERWKQNYAGPSKIGKTLILEKGLKYQPLTMSPKEINYIQGRRMAREEIAAAFGVPMSKLTTEQVNLANARIGEYQYMSDTIEPRLRRIEEKINEKLMPMYDDTGHLFAAYNSTVPEDLDFKLRERQVNLSSFYSSVNLERKKDGLEPVEWGDVPITGPGMAPLGSQPAPMGGLEALLGGGKPVHRPSDTQNTNPIARVTQSGDRADRVPPEQPVTESLKGLDQLVDRIIKAVRVSTAMEG